MYINIIIPSRGGPLGLWATIIQCNEELNNSTLVTDWKFVIVTNGEEKVNEGTLKTLEFLDNNNKLIHYHSKESLSPPEARQKGVELSDAEILFFFDNHCLPQRHYFDRAILFFQESESHNVLHSVTKFFTHDFPCYHYTIKNHLTYNFWGNSQTQPVHYKPYKMAMGGHGGFAVRKSLWEKVGGYGPSHLLKGYGGEEPIFDLRVWLYGYEVHIDPKMVHYHYAGDRGYSRHYTKEYYVNMLSAAFVVGGEKWLYKILNSLITNKHIMSSAVPPPSVLAEEAFIRCKDFYKKESLNYKMTLDELLEWFNYNGVAS